MAGLREQIPDMEQLSNELLKLMAENKGTEKLKDNLPKQEKMFDKLLDTQKTTKQLIKDLIAAEEAAAQKLHEREQELNASLQKLKKIEDELCQQNKDATLRTSIKELSKELEALKEEIRQQERKAAENVDASTSAKYLVHLYYQISHIDWDYSCEPNMIKGIHYGPDIAQPINLDSTLHSRCFISDYLWSMVNTSWSKK
uniref:Kinetochore protein Spc24 n=1 Tax=Anolis carolinensis TaxID=28377 RepID=A0A803TPC5_ANOCA|nr:PREDICTED: kinetochore protein Spc24 [Anolis carolinensis]|eukprot:XP_008101300.1 PREDICTED: kinetochore protein Spc24 [Anolis carolinensis]